LLITNLRCASPIDIDHLRDHVAEAMFEPLGEPAAVALPSSVDVFEAQHTQPLAGVLAGDGGKSRDELAGLLLQPVHVATPSHMSGQVFAEDPERGQVLDEDERAVSPEPGRPHGRSDRHAVAGHPPRVASGYEASRPDRTQVVVESHVHALRLEGRFGTGSCVERLWLRSFGRE
jgi:hypothetical protein